MPGTRRLDTRRCAHQLGPGELIGVHRVRSPGNHGSPRPRRRVARIWAAAWLPLSLAGLAVVLAPRVDGFLLGVLLIMFALATTWLPGLICRIRRRTHGVNG